MCAQCECAHCQCAHLHIVSVHYEYALNTGQSEVPYPLNWKGNVNCVYILCTYDLWMTCSHALHTIYLSLWPVKVTQMGPVWHSTLLYYISLLPGCWNIDDHHRNPNTNKVNTLRASPQSLSWLEIMGTRNTCSTKNIFHCHRMVW